MEFSEQVRIRELLTSHILSVCNTSLSYGEEVTIEGLLGITVDRKDIILVNIKELISMPMEPVEAVEEDLSGLPCESMMPKLRAALQGVGPASITPCSRKGKRKAVPFKLPYSQRQAEAKRSHMEGETCDMEGHSAEITDNVKAETTEEPGESTDVSQDTTAAEDTAASTSLSPPHPATNNPSSSNIAVPYDEEQQSWQWISQHSDIDNLDNDANTLSSQNGDNAQCSNAKDLSQYNTQDVDTLGMELLDPLSIMSYQRDQSPISGVKSTQRALPPLDYQYPEHLVQQGTSSKERSPQWASRKRVVRKHNPELMAELVQKIRSGAITLADAARKYNIPRPTLSDKVRGRTPITTDKQNRRVLTPEEEEELVVWCLEQASSGANPTITEFMKQVNQYLQNHGRSSLANSKEWLKSFLRRHSELTSSGITFDT